jgi:hypothetical protein
VPEVAQVEINLEVVGRAEIVDEIADFLVGIGCGEIVEESNDSGLDVGIREEIFEDALHWSGVAGDQEGVEGGPKVGEDGGGQGLDQVGFHLVDRLDGRVGLLAERTVEERENRPDDGVREPVREGPLDVLYVALGISTPPVSSLTRDLGGSRPHLLEGAIHGVISNAV